MVSEKAFKDVASILRRDVLQMTTKAGSGHPSSCFSAAEIMSVLFFHEMNYDAKNPENEDNDEFILSKGHAAPILYACLKRASCINEDLMTLRKINSSLEGHPTPVLRWIKVASGSLGQGPSIGLGMALSARLRNNKARTYVLVGDSECAEGSVYEALELASYYKLNNLCIIVDVNRLGQRGETMLGHDLSAYEKRFKGFGCEIIKVNGHSIPDLLKAFKKARTSKRPVVILAKTLKGKGLKLFENKEGWHGKILSEKECVAALKVLPNPVFPKVSIQKPKKSKESCVLKPVEWPKFELNQEVATREAYGKALAALAKADSNVIALDAEVSNSTFSEEVKKVKPKQFIEAFIAEQNLVGMSLGFAVKHWNVFASSFAAFLTRAHDQLRMAALSNASFTLCGSHAGVSIGEDGSSQMGLEDIAMFRALPASIVLYPCDAVSTVKLMELASKNKGIKYIRTSRPKTKVLYENSESFELGSFKVLRKGFTDKAVLVGAGITTHESLKAYELLKQKGMFTAVIDLYCIKPFNKEEFIKFVKEHGSKIIVTEDHYSQGGIGEMLSGALLNTNIQIKVLSMKEIPHSGKKEELMEKYEIDAKAIVREVLR